MAGMSGIQDLFEHELKDIYDAESRLVDALRKQAEESESPQIRKAFESHRKQTEEQVRRVEKVFEIMGRDASRGSGCAGMKGLIQEHKSFVGEDPSADVLDAFNLTAAAKVERYEITAYEGLMRMAKQMGKDEAVDLLEKNLKEERATLEKVEDLMDSANPLRKEG